MDVAQTDSLGTDEDESDCSSDESFKDTTAARKEQEMPQEVGEGSTSDPVFKYGVGVQNYFNLLQKLLYIFGKKSRQ